MDRDSQGSPRCNSEPVRGAPEGGGPVEEGSRRCGWICVHGHPVARARTERLYQVCHRIVHGRWTPENHTR